MSNTITLTLTVPAEFTIASKAAGQSFTIDTAKIVNPADLIGYALGVIVQRAPAGKADDKAASKAAIETRIAGLYSGTSSRAPRKDLWTRVAEEMLAAFAKARGKVLPKKSTDEYAAIFDKFIAAQAQAIEDEMNRREELANMDLDDIF